MRVAALSDRANEERSLRCSRSVLLTGTGKQAVGSARPGFSDAFSKKHIVNLPLENGKLRVTIVVDRNPVEVFAGAAAKSW
jgi:sucrose-6-phosphate hydrolase SacC (GH32 family)